MIVAGEILQPPPRLSVRLLGIAKLSRRQHARAQLHNPHLKMVRRNTDWSGITAALFIEHSSEI
jgi:hypothetical protein